MSLTQDIGPYASQTQGASVLETTTVLSSILRPHGYSRDTINDLAVGLFIDNENSNIKAAATMHLLAVKKALLYATPVIAPPHSTAGIALTSQVSSPAIQFDAKKTKATKCGLCLGDKFRLIGFAFEPQLINHLSSEVFPWKFFKTLPLHYTPSTIDLSNNTSFDTKQTKYGNIHLIKSKHYEDVELFNYVNRLIALKLNELMTSVLALEPHVHAQNFPQLGRIEGFNKIPFIEKLNAILPRQIDKTYSMSFYESLQMTANWLLYDQIELLGFESTEVRSKLTNLAYVKEQKLKVQANIREVTYQRLLETRAEKITRERYPYYFDFTDRRAVFVRFNRFSLDKLPKKEQNEIQTLLEKDLAAQRALLNNKCEHLKHIKHLRDSNDHGLEAYKAVEQYINYDVKNADHMYPCKLCSYPLLCEHEVTLYDTLSGIDVTNDNSDQMYWAQQKVINQYKLIDQRRTGEEDTEVSFTYYCKHCGGELGKTDDIIQSTLKTQSVSTSVIELDPTDISIYSGVGTVISQYMNQSIVPMSKKGITKLIFNECRVHIHQHLKMATKVEREFIDSLIRYLAYAYTLASLISINVNKLKSESGILTHGKRAEARDAEPVSGGAQLKDELLTALKIIQSITALKQIGITDDKIKGMLIQALKAVNKTFSDESIEIKSPSPQMQLELNIRTGPIAAYAEYMYRRQHRKSNEVDILQITGIDMAVLFPKGKKTQPIGTHALYRNIYKAPSKEGSDIVKYKNESYDSLVRFLSQEPIIGKYTSTVTEPISKFSQEFEKKQTQELKDKRTVPIWSLPVENGREYDFNLHVYQLAYCLTDNESIRPHRWKVSKANSKLVFTCKYCNITIDKAQRSNNDKIEDRLDEQMALESFFELYLISCPIKDAHIFNENTCIQCNVTKEQLNAMDPKYYKRYLSTYSKHREAITKEIINGAGEIIAYGKPLSGAIKQESNSAKPDLVKLESLATSIAKLYGHKGLDKLGMVDEQRYVEIVESYVRLFYSHYTFVKNLSIDMKTHPDPQFFVFIKENYFINGSKPKTIKLPELDPFPASNNADELLVQLYQSIYKAIDKGDGDTNKLIKFIVDKIVSQDTKRKAFNFAKLKALNTTSGDDDQPEITLDEEEDEEEFDMFDGYDISADDMEDNIDGDID